LEVGRKVGFEIMARLPTLKSISNLSEEMVNIMGKLSVNKLESFMSTMIKDSENR